MNGRIYVINGKGHYDSACHTKFVVHNLLKTKVNFVEPNYKWLAKPSIPKRGYMYG
jgi:hypothetical protein